MAVECGHTVLPPIELDSWTDRQTDNRLQHCFVPSTVRHNNTQSHQLYGHIIDDMNQPRSAGWYTAFLSLHSWHQFILFGFLRTSQQIGWEERLQNGTIL